MNLFINKQTGKPVGLLFIGECDGDIVSPQEMYQSFIAAFGFDREKNKSLSTKIEDAKTQNNSDSRITKETDLEIEK